MSAISESSSATSSSGGTKNDPDSNVELAQLMPLDVPTALALAHGAPLISTMTMGVLSHKSGRRRGSKRNNNNNNNNNNNDDDDKKTNGPRRRPRDDGDHDDGDDDKNWEATKGIRADSALWFVPEFHTIEIAELVAETGTRRMFCVVKIRKDNELGETDASEVPRSVVFPIEVIRRHFPHLLIDFLLLRAVHGQ